MSDEKMNVLNSSMIKLILEITVVMVDPCYFYKINVKHHSQSKSTDIITCILVSVLTNKIRLLIHFKSKLRLIVWYNRIILHSIKAKFVAWGCI